MTLLDPPSESAPADRSDPGPADPAVTRWFRPPLRRRPPASAIRPYTSGNLVEPLVHGAAYFPRLLLALQALAAGDLLLFAAFRVDSDQLLAGPGTAIGELLAAAAARGVRVAGLVWRSQPRQAAQSEQENAQLARRVTQAGGAVLLDPRTRRGGSHHQKLFICRYRDRPGDDVAFVGGIDVARSRRDDDRHAGDPQVMAFPEAYGPRPAWHDVQLAIHGPAVNDLELTFRERWDGSTVLDLPSPARMLIDRAYHASNLTGAPLPAPLPDPAPAGPHAVQVLRTYPARWRRYPFAPLGERSIAGAYRTSLALARRLVYIEDQYLWAPGVAALLAQALRDSPELRLIAVVPRFPDKQGRARLPSLAGRESAIDVCRAAGRDRFAIYDVESPLGAAVYVHAKVVVVDDIWAMVGSDNMNRRSWTHDSELSCAVLDASRDPRSPQDPAGQGDGARRFARDLRLQLWREHLDRPADGSDEQDLLDPEDGFAALADSAQRLQAWYAGGGIGPRPPGRLRPHGPERLRRRDRIWAVPVSRALYDPDGRAWRDRLRGRP